MKRIAVCDIRPVISDPCAGVATYIVSQLPHIIYNLKDKGYSVVFFSAGTKYIELPESLRTIMRARDIEHVHVFVPNKLLTMSALTGIGKRYDEYVSERCEGEVVEWLILDPGPWHVSDSVRLSLLFHDLSVELFPDFFPRSWSIKRSLLFRKNRIARVDVWMTVSENTKRELASVYDISSERIFTLPEPSFAHMSVSESNIQMRKRVLFISTLSPRKNLIAALRAWESLADAYPEYVFDIIGARGWKSKKDIAIVDALGSRRVVYHGSVSHNEKKKLLSEALVLIYPSLYEGLGIPPQEARAEGIPAIISDSSSLVKNAGGWGVVCRPYDIQSIIDAFKTVFESYDYWKSKVSRID